MKKISGIFACIACALLAVCFAEPLLADPGLVVHLDQPGFTISPTFYGLMTEEINHSYDGGLYAELIRNRAFLDNASDPVHWSLVTSQGAVGAIALDTSDPVNATALTTSLRIDATTVSTGQRVGVANDGFWGIPVKPHTRYKASFYARASAGFTGPMTVDIESADGATVYAKGTVSGVGTGWKKYNLTLSTGDCEPSTNNRFVISASAPGSVWLSLVSLFPPTYHNTPNGNRIDLMDLLAGMKPSFLRLPGGNYLEGNSIADRFNWKTTIGDLSQRPGHQGPWGYRSSDGLGLLEYLEWCEDLHMQTVLAIYAGYSLRGEHVDPGPALQPYVQDALDEVEYATGGTDTAWGSERAKDGHPKPFVVNYIEVGNEDGFDRSGSYDGRFAQFYDAIKAKYPNLKIIATARVTSRTPDVNDDHYYRTAVAMERDAGHYDGYDRNGPKIFVGEWASTEGRPTPTYHAALGDAAWLTGLEHNSDLVVMESYAPLLVNVNPGASQWGTNLIGYDAMNSFGSPSYYVQSMFANYTGSQEVPVTITQPAPPPATPVAMPQGKIGVGTYNTQAEFADIKVTSNGATLYQKDFATDDSDWTLGPGTWQVADDGLQQTSGRTPAIATAGETTWTDYTYSLRAKKLSGAEGFLILFHYQDRNNFVQWNIGGWGNTRTRIERKRDGDTMEVGPNMPVTVETGRWYDIRAEVQGAHIRLFIDDKLVGELDDPPSIAPDPIYAAASLDKAHNALYLKVVNAGDSDVTLPVTLNGAGKIGNKANAEVMTGDSNDQNSIDQPMKDAPKSMSIDGVGQSFTHLFPARSVTVMKVSVGGTK